MSLRFGGGPCVACKRALRWEREVRVPAYGDKALFGERRDVKGVRIAHDDEVVCLRCYCAVPENGSGVEKAQEASTRVRFVDAALRALAVEEIRAAMKALPVVAEGTW